MTIPPAETDEKVCKICWEENLPIKCNNCPCRQCLGCTLEWHKQRPISVGCLLQAGKIMIPYDCIYCKHQNVCPALVKVAPIPINNVEDSSVTSAQKPIENPNTGQEIIREFLQRIGQSLTN